MTDPESLARARAEFDPFKEGEDDIEKIFRDVLTLEKSGDLTYLGYCIQESLRINPVSVGTSQYWFEKDTKLGNLNI